jgi:hypothetical protein
MLVKKDFSTASELAMDGQPLLAPTIKDGEEREQMKGLNVKSNKAIVKEIINEFRSWGWSTKNLHSSAPIVIHPNHKFFVRIGKTIEYAKPFGGIENFSMSGFQIESFHLPDIFPSVFVDQMQRIMIAYERLQEHLNLIGKKKGEKKPYKVVEDCFINELDKANV